MTASIHRPQRARWKPPCSQRIADACRRSEPDLRLGDRHERAASAGVIQARRCNIVAFLDSNPHYAGDSSPGRPVMAPRDVDATPTGADPRGVGRQPIGHRDRGPTAVRAGCPAHPDVLNVVARTTATAPERVFVTGHTGFKGAWLAEWLDDAGRGRSLATRSIRRREPNLFDALGLGDRVQPRRRRRPRSRPPGRRGPGGAAVGDLPPGRAGARPARVRGAARDVRDQRHGHGQRARGGPRLPVGPRGRHRDERQVLREPRDRPRLPRDRPDGWPRPVRRQQGVLPSWSRPPTARASSRTGRRSPPSAPATSSAAATGRPIGSSRIPCERWSPASRSSSATRMRSARGSTSSNRCPATSGSARCCSRTVVATRARGTSARPRSGPISRCAGWSIASSTSGAPARGRRRPSTEGQPHEAQRLSLDSAKAREQLGWAPVWDPPTAVRRTASWYREYYRAPASARELVER